MGTYRRIALLSDVSIGGVYSKSPDLYSLLLNVHVGNFFTAAEDICTKLSRPSLASYPGLPSQLFLEPWKNSTFFSMAVEFFHSCEKSREGRPGYEARPSLPTKVFGPCCCPPSHGSVFIIFGESISPGASAVTAAV